MEIERINENTVKFFLSYIDIEERGFTREEVWYNREKSEELFWDMMDEINEEAEFEVEGPLWIQVHAMNNGIEVTVTKAQPNDEQMPEGAFEQHESRRMFQPPEDFPNVDDILTASGKPVSDSAKIDDMFVFKDFEELIRIASRLTDYDAKTSLYSYNSEFYLNVIYNEDLMDGDDKTNMYFVLSEFSKPSTVTMHILEEYGKVIMESDVFNEIQKYF